MRKIFFLVALVLLAAFAIPSSAREWYVDAGNGSDTTGDGSEGAPYTSWDKVFSSGFAGGDTLYLAGTFYQTLIISSTYSGTAEQTTTIAGWQGFAEFNLAGQEVNYGVEVNADYITLSSLDPRSALLAGIGVSNAHYINIIDCQPHYNGKGFTIADSTDINMTMFSAVENSIGVYIDNVTNLAIDRAFLRRNEEIGLYLEEVTTASVTNSAIYDNDNPPEGESSYEIFVNSANGLQIINNTIYGQPDYALSLNNSQVVTIYNNIFMANGYAIYADDSTTEQITADYNNFYLNTNNYNQTLTDQDNHSLSVEPLFWNEYRDSEDIDRDFRLQRNSPLVDVGKGVNLTNDWHGETRPYKNGYDIGADEAQYPDPISSFICTPASNSVLLDWEAPAGELTSYSLTYGLTADLVNAVEITGITDSQYAITDLLANTLYYFAIQAHNGDYESEIFSSNFSTTPSKVKKFHLTKKWPKKVKLAWKVKKNVDYYQIKVMTKKGKKVRIVKVVQNVKIVKRLKAKRVYKFQVRVVKDDLKSEWSKILRVKTKKLK